MELWQLTHWSRTEINRIDKVSRENILDFHVKFERIHPFQDGNGRVGRVIIFKHRSRRKK